MAACVEARLRLTPIKAGLRVLSTMIEPFTALGAYCRAVSRRLIHSAHRRLCAAARLAAAAAPAWPRASAPGGILFGGRDPGRARRRGVAHRRRHAGRDRQGMEMNPRVPWRSGLDTATTRRTAAPGVGDRLVMAKSCRHLLRQRRWLRYRPTSFPLFSPHRASPETAPPALLPRALFVPTREADGLSHRAGFHAQELP